MAVVGTAVSFSDCPGAVALTEASPEFERAGSEE
jgi:hypothetical protein